MRCGALKLMKSFLFSYIFKISSAEKSLNFSPVMKRPGHDGRVALLYGEALPDLQHQQHQDSHTRHHNRQSHLEETELLQKTPPVYMLDQNRKIKL